MSLRAHLSYTGVGEIQFSEPSVQERHVELVPNITLFSASPFRTSHHSQFQVIPISSVTVHTALTASLASLSVLQIISTEYAAYYLKT